MTCTPLYVVVLIALPIIYLLRVQNNRMSQAHIEKHVAYVVHGELDAKARTIAPYGYMEDLLAFFDSADHGNVADYYHEDFSVNTPHAEKHTHGHGAFADSVGKFFIGPFKEFKHLDYTRTAVQTKEGWDMYTRAEIYANLKGDPLPHERRIKDDSGREWDVVVPVFYYHELIKVQGAPHCKHWKTWYHACN